MNMKAIISGIIAIIVAVVLVTGAVIPALSDIQTGSDSESTTIYTDYTNVGSPFALVDSSGVAHAISVGIDNGELVVTTDGTDAGGLDLYVPQSTGTANAIAIGVYEAYNNNGVLTSMSGVSPTVSQTIDKFRSQALAGNTDVTNGTYQLWNFYQYTLMKMMGLTVMGNTDSQYMMGAGITNGSITNTGTTSSAYQKSTSGTTAESLFIENGWGNIMEFVGDVNFNDYVINAGNTLGGNAIASVEGINTTMASIPSSSGYYIDTINMNPDVWGIPLTVTSTSATTSGQGINDREWTGGTGQKSMNVGGGWNYGDTAGLSAFSTYYALNISYTDLGSRLAYVMPDGGSPSADYGYVITFDTTSGQTIISNVEVQDNGTLVSKMPSGTTLNSYWDFDSVTGVGPFGAYYVAINLSSGANADDSTEARLSTQKGEIAYRLNPNNLHQTLAGTTFDPTLYNVMIVIPTAYWYSDPATNKLYIGSSADKFDGITMVPYAHNYTIDPDVDTGNPPRQVNYASMSIAVGEDSIVRLYANGDVKLITTSDTVLIGTADAGTDVTFSITDSVLTYGADTQSDMKAYISSVGTMVMAHTPYIANGLDIIIGGYTNDLTTSNDGTVDIGYCASGDYEGFGDTNVTAVLNPSVSPTSTAVTVNATDLDTGAYQINSILFTSTYGDESTSTATYTYFLAPASFTAEKTEEHDVPSYLDGSLKSLVSLIPLLILVGAVIGAISLWRYGNRI